MQVSRPPRPRRCAFNAPTSRRSDVAPLRIGLSSTIDIELILPFLDDLADFLPGLELDLDRGEANTILSDLEDGRLEFGLAGSPIDTWDRINSTPLFSEGFVAVVPASHPIGGLATASVSVLGRESIIARPYCEQYERLDGFLRDNGAEFSRTHRPASEADLFSLISHRKGLGLAPTSTILPPGLVGVPIQQITPDRQVTLYSVAGRRFSVAAAHLSGLFAKADWSKHLSPGDANCAEYRLLVRPSKLPPHEIAFAETEVARSRMPVFAEQKG